MVMGIAGVSGEDWRHERALVSVFMSSLSSSSQRVRSGEAERNSLYLILQQFSNRNERTNKHYQSLIHYNSKHINSDHPLTQNVALELNACKLNRTLVSQLNKQKAFFSFSLRFKSTFFIRVIYLIFFILF